MSQRRNGLPLFLCLAGSLVLTASIRSAAAQTANDYDFFNGYAQYGASSDPYLYQQNDPSTLWWSSSSSVPWWHSSSSYCAWPYTHCSSSSSSYCAWPYTNCSSSSSSYCPYPYPYCGSSSSRSFPPPQSCDPYNPDFPTPPVGTYYLRCVQPALAQRERDLLRRDDTYWRQNAQLLQQRARDRVQAWTFPRRADRIRAERDANRAYTLGIRELNRWYREEDRRIRTAFSEAERSCDRQYDDNPRSSSSSSSSRSSSSQSSFIPCMPGDACLRHPHCSTLGGVITPPLACGYPDAQQQGYACCRLPPITH